MTTSSRLSVIPGSRFALVLGAAVLLLGAPVSADVTCQSPYMP